MHVNHAGTGRPSAVARCPYASIAKISIFSVYMPMESEIGSRSKFFKPEFQTIGTEGQNSNIA